MAMHKSHILSVSTQSSITPRALVECQMTGIRNITSHGEFCVSVMLYGLSVSAEFWFSVWLVRFACLWCSVCFQCLLCSGALCDQWCLCVCGFLCALCILWDLVFSVTARWGLYVCVLYGSSEFWCSVWPVKFVCLVWFVCFWCLRCSVLSESAEFRCSMWLVRFVCLWCSVCPLSFGVLCEHCVCMSPEFWCCVCDWWGLRVYGVLCAFCVCWVLVFHWPVSQVCLSWLITVINLELVQVSHYAQDLYPFLWS